MSNVSNLFENLMTYNDTKRKRIDESDSTLVNLTVELPNDTEEITPEDVKVDVGVMSVDTTDVEETEELDDTEETSEEDETDTDVPAEETEESSENEDETEEQKDDEKDTNESLKLKRESILKKRLETKNIDESTTDVETAKKNIRRRVNNFKEEVVTNDVDEINEGIFDKMKEKKANKFKETAKQEFFNTVGAFAKMKDTGFSFESDFIYDSKKAAHDVMYDKGWATGKGNSYFKKINKYRYEAQLGFNVDNKWNISILYGEKDVKKESEETQMQEANMQLDTKSFNNLITQFVTENYKNIKKVVITKATLENCSLTLSGKIIDMNGKTESIILANKGFDPTKLENKKFIMDFKDVSNTFNIVKESVQHPFVFTATLQNGVLKFENLKYSFKTKINESRVADLCGKCVLKENK